MDEKHMTDIKLVRYMNQGPENKTTYRSTLNTYIVNTYIVGQKLDSVWEAGAIG